MIEKYGYTPSSVGASVGTSKKPMSTGSTPAQCYDEIIEEFNRKGFQNPNRLFANEGQLQGQILKQKIKYPMVNYVSSQHIHCSEYIVKIVSSNTSNGIIGATIVDPKLQDRRDVDVKALKKYWAQKLQDQKKNNSSIRTNPSEGELEGAGGSV